MSTIIGISSLTQPVCDEDKLHLDDDGGGTEGKTRWALTKFMRSVCGILGPVFDDRSGVAPSRRSNDHHRFLSTTEPAGGHSYVQSC